MKNIIFLSFLIILIVNASDNNLKKSKTIHGVTVQLGGESESDGMIDQFWFAKLFNEGKIPNGIQMVDVRKVQYFKKGHVKGAINAPYDFDKDYVDISNLPKDKLIVFYCNTGIASTDARFSLKKEQSKNILIFDAAVQCDKNNNCTARPNENI